MNNQQEPVRGVNEWARRFVTELRAVAGTEYVTRIFIGGRSESETRHITRLAVEKEESGEYCVDICGNEHPLHTYTFPNGKVFREIVQDSNLINGPAIFLALQDEDGELVKESVWTIEEMKQ